MCVCVRVCVYLQEVDGACPNDAHPHLMGDVEEVMQLFPRELSGAQNMLHVQAAVGGHVTRWWVGVGWNERGFPW